MKLCIYTLFVAVMWFLPAGIEAQSTKEASSNEFLVTTDKMIVFEAQPGEVVHIVEGKSHGFESLSVAITETKPGSGAPSHIHKCEEAHILLEGEVEYQIGSSKFIAKAPYVVRIPANTKHSFTNIGSGSIKVIGVFPKNSESEIDPQAK